MAGGGEAAFAAAEPILQAHGQDACSIAARPAPGQAAKICNNMILGISMIAVAKPSCSARSSACSQQALFDVASTSSGPVLVAHHLLPGAGPGADQRRPTHGYRPGLRRRR